MRILAVIPARYGSSRLPGKPLADIAGKSMIQRVYEQVSKCNAVDTVLVATDDDRIFDHVREFGGEVMMTSTDHSTGTDRLCEVAGKMTEYDAYLNVQGDEPFIRPNQIEEVCKSLGETKNELVSTLASPSIDQELYDDPNWIKVVVDKNGRALYFSRSPIPFSRNPEAGKEFLLHLGIYGFTRAAVDRITGMAQTDLEKKESLEQLRWMDNGIEIRVAIVEHGGISVDSDADLERARNFALTNE